MRKVKALKPVTAALLAIGLILSCSNISVFAAVASGAKKIANVNGYSYTYHSKVNNDSSSTFARGIVESSIAVPTGYMGIDARLFNSQGTLVASSGMYYSPEAIGGMDVGSSNYSAKGTFYSQARMEFYNGNGYTSYTSYASPNLQRSSVPMIPEKTYEVNEIGLTYGSDFYVESLEDSPNLIRVIGKNGIEGYVYSKDINLELNTLAEVLDYINSGQPNYIVPVYKEDGVTIVDTFEITADVDTMGVIRVSDD